MISFGEFNEIIESDKQIRECAALISKSSKEPKEIIESVLEIEILESWLGRTAKAAGQIIGGVAGGVAAGATRAVQGVNQAADTISGPLTKFQTAVDILKDLEKTLRNNPATKGIASKSNPKRSIAGYIQAVYQALEKERLSMPQMVGNNRLGSETPDKYLRGSQIQKRQSVMNAPSQQPAQQPAQTQQQQPTMRLAQ